MATSFETFVNNVGSASGQEFMLQYMPKLVSWVNDQTVLNAANVNSIGLDCSTFTAQGGGAVYDKMIELVKSLATLCNTASSWQTL